MERIPFVGLNHLGYATCRVSEGKSCLPAYFCGFNTRIVQRDINYSLITLKQCPKLSDLCTPVCFSISPTLGHDRLSIVGVRIWTAPMVHSCANPYRPIDGLSCATAQK